MYRRLHIHSRNPWLGDRLRGTIRLASVFGLIFLLGSLGSIVIDDFDTQALITGWRHTDASNLSWLVQFLLSALVFFRFSQRYFLLLTITFGAAYYFTARYLRNFYGLNGIGQAARYLNAVLFAVGYPRLEIENGQRMIPPGTTNLIDQIGGPGYLVIQPGSLVLLEGPRGEQRVCAEGLNFVTRFERIRETLSLDDQQNFIETIDFTTKDSIRMRVRDVHYAYRLRTGRYSSEAARQDPEAPYPFSLRAVLSMAYGRSVSTRGITPWERMVNIAVDGAITDYMRQRNFDDITAPNFSQTITREEIARELNSMILRNRLRTVGAELLWVDMGHFEVVDKRIEEQRVNTWGSKWRGVATYNRAFGEAKRLSYEEIGRAEAQAEMLLGIMNAFEELKILDGLSESERQRKVQEIMLARTAQFLDSMAAHTPKLSQSSRKELPPPK